MRPLRFFPPSSRVFAASACLAAACWGCARPQYLYGVAGEPAPPSSAAANPLAVGGEHPNVDRVERVVQTPARKLRQWFGREDTVDPETRRQETVALAQEYLAANSLPDVHLDVRRYEPAEQWSRLRANDRVAPGWKYTLGTLDVLGYTLLPKRALHSDRYSPFTNTLSINSTRPAGGLYAAAEAKKYRGHAWTGTYAAVQRLPLVPLAHHASVASDVLTYARVTARRELEGKLYRSTYARMGSAAVSEAAIAVPSLAGGSVYEGVAIQIAGGTAGGLVGSAVAKQQTSPDAENR